jgi:hypothetical protein
VPFFLENAAESELAGREGEKGGIVMSPLLGPLSYGPIDLENQPFSFFYLITR